MFHILVMQGCRSDIGLSNPIIKRLEKADWCDVKVVQLEPQNFPLSYSIAEYHCKAERHIGSHNRTKPDLVLIVGDRVEMTAAAQAAFLNKVPIAHVYAGVINREIATYDDVLRHTITLLSDIQFCETKETCNVVARLKQSICFGIPNVKNIHFSGITHLDDLEVDECKVPFTVSPMPESELIKVPYDLILYNTPTKGDNKKDISTIKILIDNHNKASANYTILISSNPDGDEAEDKLMCIADEYYIDLPRAQFLGLLKNCNRFITNSSSAIYEAPYFLKPEQIILVGDRNRNRPKVECVPGGSDKIVSILREYGRTMSKM